MAASTLYSFGMEATALLALWIGLAVWQHDREAPGRLTFVALTGAVVLWCVGALLLEREVVSDWWGVRLLFLGVLAVPPLWLGVAAHSARLGIARRVPWFPAALLVPSAAFYALLYTGPWSTLFLGDGGFEPEGWGPVFPVWAVYAYALILGATAILLGSAYRAREPRRRRRLALTAVSAVLPLGANAFFVFVLHETRDLTPILLGITLIALRSGIFQGGLLDALPIHHRDLYRKLPVGVVVADLHDRVLDVNEAASERLGLRREEALGRALDAVLAAAPGEVEVELATLRSGGREQLRCAVLRERGGGAREAA